MHMSASVCIILEGNNTYNTNSARASHVAVWERGRNILSGDELEWTGTSYIDETEDQLTGKARERELQNTVSVPFGPIR